MLLIIYILMAGFAWIIIIIAAIILLWLMLRSSGGGSSTGYIPKSSSLTGINQTTGSRIKFWGPKPVNQTPQKKKCPLCFGMGFQNQQQMVTTPRTESYWDAKGMHHTRMVNVTQYKTVRNVCPRCGGSGKVNA